MKLKDVIKQMQIPPTDTRVEKNTRKHINQLIKQQTIAYIAMYECASYGELSQRLEELEREWDVERILEANAAALVLTGSIIGLATGKKGWFFLSGVVGGFLLQHALQGWCPPLEIIRRMGKRTAREINIEKTAIKYLRGDFSEYTDNPSDIYQLAKAD